MLVDNKFIFLSLPRCASTSLEYSFILSNFNVQHVNPFTSEKNSLIDFTKVPQSDIMSYIEHGHETLVELEEKFGHNYPIIAVKRDRRARFFSLYQHILYDLRRVGELELYEHFKNLTATELFFFDKEDLVSKASRWNVLNDYIVKNRLKSRAVSLNLTKSNLISTENRMEGYYMNILDILITPLSFWHNHDTRIKWFDIKNIVEMEDWIRFTTKKPFTLEKVNSNIEEESTIKLDDAFIKAYDKVYDYYDKPKFNKTLI